MSRKGQGRSQRHSGNPVQSRNKPKSAKPAAPDPGITGRRSTAIPAPANVPAPSQNVLPSQNASGGINTNSQLYQVIHSSWGNDQLAEELYLCLAKMVKLDDKEAKERARVTENGFLIQLEGGGFVQFSKATADQSEVITGSKKHFGKDEANAIIILAKMHGWTDIDVQGTEKQKELLWLAAKKQGLNVTNFEPKPTSDVYKAFHNGEPADGPGISNASRGPAPTAPAPVAAAADANPVSNSPPVADQSQTPRAPQGSNGKNQRAQRAAKTASRPHAGQPSAPPLASSVPPSGKQQGPRRASSKRVYPGEQLSPAEKAAARVSRKLAESKERITKVEKAKAKVATAKPEAKLKKPAVPPAPVIHNRDVRRSTAPVPGQKSRYVPIKEIRKAAVGRSKAASKTVTKKAPALAKQLSAKEGGLSKAFANAAGLAKKGAGVIRRVGPKLAGALLRHPPKI